MNLQRNVYVFVFENTTNIAQPKLQDFAPIRCYRQYLSQSLGEMCHESELKEVPEVKPKRKPAEKHVPSGPAFLPQPEIKTVTLIVLLVTPSKRRQRVARVKFFRGSLALSNPKSEDTISLPKGTC